MHGVSGFADRREAGRRLAAALTGLREADPLVLALPRGGVPVAFEVALALSAALDLLIVRKIGAPHAPELGLGAVVGGAEPQTVLNDDVLRMVRPGEDYLAQETRRQLAEIERRRETYLGGREPVPVRGRTVILVDDGIATGGTVRAALKALHAARAARIVLAVPVAPRDVLDLLRAEADEVVCLLTPEPFLAVGVHYDDFEQTSDEEVLRLLGQAGGAIAPAGEPALKS